MDHTHLIFQVRATGDAIIAVSALPGSLYVDTLEIVIGADANTRTIMRSGINGTEEAGVDTLDILSGDELRWFWIEWEAGLMTVGKGQELRKDSLMTHMVPYLLYVSSLAFTTSGTFDSEWHIPFNPEDSGTYHLLGVRRC